MVRLIFTRTISLIIFTNKKPCKNFCSFYGKFREIDEFYTRRVRIEMYDVRKSISVVFLTGGVIPCVHAEVCPGSNLERSFSNPLHLYQFLTNNSINLKTFVYILTKNMKSTYFSHFYNQKSANIFYIS